MDTSDRSAMTGADTEKQVMAWYHENYNGPIFPLFKRQVLTRETSLSTGSYPWVWEDGEEIMDEYFARFQVDKRGFDFNKYWPGDDTFRPFEFLLPKHKRRAWIEPQPLTLGMLVESAKAGYWLYG